MSQPRDLTAKTSHSKEISQPRDLTAKRSHSKEISQQRNLTAKRSHSQEISQPRDLTAKRSHSKAISQPRDLTAKRSHSQEISQPRDLTAKRSHRKLVVTSWAFSFLGRSRTKVSFSHLPLSDFEWSLAQKLHFHNLDFHFQILREVSNEMRSSMVFL